jgi:DNA-binding MarR family transcriptional regulator
MDEITASLTRLVAVIYEEELRLLHSIGRSITEHHVLQVLATHPEITASGVAQRLSLAKSSVSFVVDQLVQEKLVAREHDLGDRRKVILSLTREGQKSMNRFWSAKAALLGRAMTQLTPEERGLVKKVFQSLIESIEPRLTSPVAAQ